MLYLTLLERCVLYKLDGTYVFMAGSFSSLLSPLSPLAPLVSSPLLSSPSSQVTGIAADALGRSVGGESKIMQAHDVVFDALTRIHGWQGQRGHRRGSGTTKILV